MASAYRMTAIDCVMRWTCGCNDPPRVAWCKAGSVCEADGRGACVVQNEPDAAQGYHAAHLTPRIMMCCTDATAWYMQI